MHDIFLLTTVALMPDEACITTNSSHPIGKKLPCYHCNLKRASDNYVMPYEYLINNFGDSVLFLS